MSVPDPSQLPAGKLFHGHYEIVRCIAAGAMGTVYEVIDQKTRRRRALKVMLPSLVSDPELRARFRLEATITADIVSEHIVETFDADVDADTGAPFLVMELLRGEDLADILNKRKRLPPEEVVLYLSQAARALDKTHAAGIIHRDLKPENLFVTHRDDGSPRVKVLDFGIAKVVAQSAGKTTTRSIGTPPYMSPEQISGENVTSKSDLYALAHIAFALLVGQPYWLEEARSAEAVYPLLVKIMKGAKEPSLERAKRLGVTLPSSFEPWFVQATSVDADDRFESARDLVAALAAALDVRAPVPSLSASIGDWSIIADRNALFASIASHQARKSAETLGAPPSSPNDEQRLSPDSKRGARDSDSDAASGLSSLPPPLPKLFGGVPADDRISSPSEPPKSAPQASDVFSVPPIAAMPKISSDPLLSSVESSASGPTASDLSSTIPQRPNSSLRRMILGGVALFLFGVIASMAVFMGKSEPEPTSLTNLASSSKEPVFEVVSSEPAPPEVSSAQPEASASAPAASASASASKPSSSKPVTKKTTRTTKTTKAGSKKKYDPLGDL